MQVVILCGGQGTRIRDVADDIPKPMIPIGGKPILWHIMKMYAHYGFKRFILCLGYKSWCIKQYFLNYSLACSDLAITLDSVEPVQFKSQHRLEDWQVTLAETGENTMTGGRVKCIEKYLEGDHFMLTYGDGVADINLHDLIDFHFKQGKTGTVTAVTPPGRFGEIRLEHSLVTDFNEKPLLTHGLISGGFFVFKREFVKNLPENPDLVLERTPLHDLSRQGQLAAYIHQGYWHCMDSSRDYNLLNNLWSCGQAPWMTWGRNPLRIAA